MNSPHRASKAKLREAYECSIQSVHAPGPATGVVGAASRHYIVVTGKNTRGNYTINDPSSSTNKTISPAELKRFVERHPEGAFFSIG